MNSHRKPLVIFHGGCADGMAAAWCFWKHFGEQAEYHAGVYNQKLPDIVMRDVYLVDFSYKREDMELMCNYANRVVLLDHHASALDDLWDLKYSNFDMTCSSLTRSGAIIAWEYIKKMYPHKRKMPSLLLNIEDRDLWNFKLPDTNELMLAVFSHNMTFETYDALFKLTKRGLDALRKEGSVLLRKQEADIERITKTTARTASIANCMVPVMNTPLYASEIAGRMSKGFPFAATYYDTPDARVFSLRSDANGIDVSKIAKVFGGGGHPRAAGFQVKRNHGLARI